jgi:hypothetical protein
LNEKSSVWNLPQLNTKYKLCRREREKCIAVYIRIANKFKDSGRLQYGKQLHQ